MCELSDPLVHARLERWSLKDYSHHDAPSLLTCISAQDSIAPPMLGRLAARKPSVVYFSSTLSVPCRSLSIFP